MMIVLEGALDLKISKDKWKLIRSAFWAAFIILGITTFLIALIIHLVLNSPSFYQSVIYAIPLSVVSSAIVIPSVIRLIPATKEFMVYESIFSDILGIMLFDFMIIKSDSVGFYVWHLSSNLVISVVLSVVFSYLLVWLFQKISSGLNLFLFLAILALLFSIGEYFHYSALLIVFIFGMVLRNSRFFFRKKLDRFVDHTIVNSIRKEFHLITEETSFFIRTLFFVIFGMSIQLHNLMRPEVLLVGFASLGVMYFTRMLNLKIFIKSGIFPELFIAPRGLVTILLFYRIPEHLALPNFNTGILFFFIITTSLIMMLGLIFTGVKEEDLQSPAIED